MVDVSPMQLRHDATLTVTPPDLSKLHLVRALMIGGDKIGAHKAYEEFLLLWKDADAEIPLYREANVEYAKLP